MPFVVVEVVGYIGRILAYDETGALLPYILQSIFLLLAPILFAATLYMTLGRVIRSADVGGGAPRMSMLPARWVTRVFVTADVVSFFIQAGGAGLLVQAKSTSATKTGQNIIVGGLVFQLVAFALFIVSGVVFNIRFNNNKYDTRVANQSIPIQGILNMMYITSILIMIRNIVRAAEYAMGQDSYLLTNEWTIYVLDGSLMLFVMIAFAVKYPSQLLQKKDAEASYDMEMDGSRSFEPLT